MNETKQLLLFECLLSSQPLYSLCSGILNPEYFDPTLRSSVRFAQKYFQDYKSVPTPKQIKAESGLNIEVHELSKAENEYISDEVEKFCRNKAVEHALLKGPALLDEGDYEKIVSILKDAISIGLHKDLGLDYFDKPEERLQRMKDNPNVYATGWDELDEYLEGGIGREELIIFMANSGVGKSVTMLNILLNMTKIHKFSGLYISLEMSADAQAGRADAIISGVAKREVMNNVDIVSSAILNASNNSGKLFFKRMPESTTTSNDIRSYLIEFQQVHGFTPDIIVIDYLDLMTTNKKIALDNLFVKDKYVAEEIRALGLEFNAIMISASQMGRGALEAETINQGHIQGGISKVNTVDNLIAILQNDMMNTSGEIVYQLVKTRNSGGKGSQVLLKWCSRTLKISNNVDSKGNVIKNMKPLNPVTMPDFVMPFSTIKKEPVAATNLLSLVKT